jgi:alanine dehydrogenase
MLVLNNDDVQRVFSVRDCMEALEQAYRAQADGTAVVRPRSQTYVPLGEPDTYYCLKTMDGSLPATGYMTLRLTSDVVSEAKVDGVPRREKLPRGPGGTYCGFIIVFSLERLAPVALIHDGFIQLYRVACTSALSVRLLARPDASVMGLLGSSGQAWAHLDAMRSVCGLRRVKVFSPNAGNRKTFATRARSELGLPAEAVDSAEAAVSGSDLVVAATNTSLPIVDGKWLAPGAHVISIVSGDQKTRRRELDDETMRRAAVVIAHSKQIARNLDQGDLAEPVAAGILDWDSIHDLSELLAGRAPGRRSPQDITVFKNNVGLGLQFAAVAPRIYELALKAGIGRELPGELFLQEMKP